MASWGSDYTVDIKIQEITNGWVVTYSYKDGKQETHCYTSLLKMSNEIMHYYGDSVEDDGETHNGKG